MEAVKNKVIKLVKWTNFPFIVLGVGMLVVHFVLNIGFGDDAWFINLINNENFNVWSHIVARYYDWTSRLFIELVFMGIVQCPLLWIFLDTAIMVLIAVFISKIFLNTQCTRNNWIIVCLILVFPFITVSNAGWIASTMSYTWVLSFGLISIYPIKKILNNKKIKWYEYIIYLSALVYAINNEQMCIVLLTVFLFANIYIYIVNKKINWYLIMPAILSVASLSFILTCPGNTARRISEISTWFPEYANISILRKIEMGFSSSLYEFIMKPNMIFTIFAGLLLVCMLIKHQNRFYRTIAAIPFVSSLIFGIFSNISGGIFPAVTIIINSMTKFGTIISLTSIKSWIPDTILLIICLSIITSVCLIFKNKKELIISIFVLILGFGTRMIMAFSPTIWASGSRTFVFMYFAFIICCVIFYNEITKADDMKYRIFSMSFITLIACLSFINSLYILP